MFSFFVLGVSLNPFVWLGNLMSEAIKILNSVIGNWGIAIILLTLITKLLLYPLNKKSMDSIKATQELQPEVEKIKKKYKNNQQEIQMKTMELYKEKGINPAAGCLPLLIQMPILIGLYSSIRGLESELVNAKFLWLDSLTKTGDITLIILTGLVTFLQSYLQQKMTTSSGANQNALMTYMMPILIIFISRTLPAGVLLYWFTSTLIMAIQQFLSYQKQPVLKEE